MSKKILVLGATGAMGRYLVPELVKLGYAVTGVSLDNAVVTGENITHIKGNAFDKQFLETLLENQFDGIVNFMSYPPRQASV